jgi:hypothetical protein
MLDWSTSMTRAKMADEERERIVAYISFPAIASSILQLFDFTSIRTFHEGRLRREGQERAYVLQIIQTIHWEEDSNTSHIKDV